MKKFKNFTEQWIQVTFKEPYYMVQKKWLKGYLMHSTEVPWKSPKQFVKNATKEQVEEMLDLAFTDCVVAEVG